MGFVEVLEYDLPDGGLIDVAASGDDWFFWLPDQPYLILGQSNNAEKSLFSDLVIQDQIPVYKRPSGGESVILTPKTLVISVRLLSDRLENPQVYFKRINNAIIKGLASLGVKNLGYRGISDITIEQKKILGSSIYRKKNLVFYHAVLNMSEDIALIAKYLQHPSKEPDYRAGRKHKNFVTSLAEAGHDLSAEQLINAIESEFKKGI